MNYRSLQALVLFCLTAITASAQSPYLYRLVGQPTYYRDAVAPLFSLNTTESSEPQDYVNVALVQLYMRHPEMVSHHDRQFEQEALPLAAEDSKPSIAEQVQQVLETDTDPSVSTPPVVDIDDIGLTIERPNFWKFKGTAALQFTQNYFSENWYKGGDNNNTLLASILLEAKYNDERRVTWDNRLDMRLGFVTTKADTCHNFITNNDRINLYSKLGVKAAKSWFYAASVEANTQFLPGYRTNDRKTYSRFLAPLDFFASLGMDFKPELKNGNELSVAFLPLSYKFRYIGHDDENIHKQYKMVGENFHQDFGAKLEFNARLRIVDKFFWKSRCYYFTSYEYTEAEFENSFQYQFSKYIMAEVYTLWRFDDNRSPDLYDDNLGYFQFKEYFTLGLTYNF